MDNIIEKLIKDFHLTDYEALIVTGIMGIKAVENKQDLNEIYNDIENKLKPIVNKLLCC